MTTHTAESLPGYDRWLESPYRDRDPEPCPHCGEDIDPHSEECEHCGAYVGHEHPDPDSQYGGHDNPRDDDYSHEYSKVMTSKFHILGDNELPGEVDHSRVDQMSQAQMGAHQRLVNYAVTKLNDAISGGAAIDASFLENLKLDITNQFGIPAQESETIVDQAMRQSQNQDGTLDALAPAPVEQSAAPAEAPNPQMATGVGQGPEPVPVANGAFTSSRGLPAKVTHTWHDIYGDEWVELQDSRGYRESVLASEIKTGDVTLDDPVAEIRTFLADTEPKSLSGTEIKARLANLKLASQEIRRLIANKRVSDSDAAKLDNIRQDVEVELLNLTDAVASDSPVYEAPVEAIFDVADHIAPTLYGVDEISDVGETEPMIASEDIESAIPEEAAVFATEHEGVNPAALLSMAASHMDSYTAGHPAEVRAHHRSRFVQAVKAAASRTTTHEPESTRTASADEEDLSLYDGPAEAIFSWPGQ